MKDRGTEWRIEGNRSESQLYMKSVCMDWHPFILPSSFQSDKLPFNSFLLVQIFCVFKQSELYRTCLSVMI